MGGTLLIDGWNLGVFQNAVAWAQLLDQAPLLLAEASPLAQLLSRVWVILQVALGLGFVIFVHELGHFLAAKTFGVRCDKFYVGFDVPISIGPIKLPRTLGKFQWGETEYGIGIIPLGGYVKMLGQDDDPRAAEEEAKKIRLGEDEQAPLDPRSYPAKPVWQRMIIISAGVVMNLIFAVLMAAVAYWYGVPYPPTVAGSTLAGSPAWIAGVETGDQVVKFGKMQEEDTQLRYNDFAGSVVMQGFDDKGKPMPFTLLRDGQKVDLSIAPSSKNGKDSTIYRVGLMPPMTPKISSPAYSPISYLAQSTPDLQPGDVVTGVDGDKLPVDPRLNQVLGSELTSRLQAKFEKPVSIQIERPANEPEGKPQALTVELPPVPVKSLGLGFACGPITALQQGSAAEKMGLQVGDVIVSINGQPVDNALQLPALVGGLAGQEIKLVVRRPATASTGSPGSAGSDSASTPATATNTTATNTTAANTATAAGQSVEFTLPGPVQAAFDPIPDFAGELTLGGIGIAMSVSPEIASIDSAQWPQGAPFEVGDKLTQVQWLASPEMKKEVSKVLRPEAFETFVIDQQFTLASLYDLLQSFPADAEIKCWASRDGKTVEGTATLAYAKDWYWHQRGIALSLLTSMHQTDSLANALKLGVWETARSFRIVLDSLRLLVTGKVGAKGFGGPIAIAQAAGSEASLGASRLLIFLTLLSANLAILNFLPIPALDGGHMVFLLAEAIRGKPVNEALQVRLTMLGVLGLLSLMAFVIVNDLMRLVG